MFEWIWIVVGLLMVIVGLFQAGRTGNYDYFLLAIAGIVWPALALVALVLSPFIGLYQLGKLVGKRS